MVSKMVLSTMTAMSKLFDNPPITQDEKLAFKQQSNFDSPKKKDDKKRRPKHVENPMLLNTVIECVLKYLNLEDIKRCRFICKKWSKVLQPILRTRSKIKLSNYKWDLTIDLPFFHPCNFFEVFSETLESIPFTAFKLYGNSEFPWALQDLNEFFKHQQEKIREFEINNLCLTSENGESFNSFDITPWISRSRIARKTKYHTKLDVLGYFDSPNVRIIIQNDILTNVKELNLSRCQIDLRDPLQLRPIKLTLHKVAFFKYGKKLADVCINEIFDLPRTKHIDLECLDDESKSTELSLVLKGRVNLDYLRLSEGIAVTNWRSCKWAVKEMRCYQPFVEKTQMQVQILDLGHQEKINISVLPISIEKLTICITNRKYLVGSNKAVLHNLKYLSLSLAANCFSEISDFVTCPNLVDLHIQGFDDQHEIINSDWIPKSIKRLKLRHIAINWIEGHKDFNLEKLVLIYHSFSDVKKICSILKQTQELVICCPCGAQEYKTILDFLEYLDLRKRWDSQQRIYVGPFNWADFSFENSLLVDYVDRQSTYYIFENHIGKALDIDKSQFKEFENIDTYGSIAISKLLI